MVKASNNPEGLRVLVKWTRPLSLSRPAGREAPRWSCGGSYWESDPQGTFEASLLRNASDIAFTYVYDTWVKNHDGRQFRVRRAKDEPDRYEFIPSERRSMIRTNRSSARGWIPYSGFPSRSMLRTGLNAS